MRLAILSLSLAVGWPVTALAQVTFDDALALGARAPTAQRARRALEARQRGDAQIGGTAQGTTVTVMPGAVLNPDQERGFDLQLNATQGWNLGDLGGARRRAASHERDALGAQARAEALRARLEAAHRWIELHTLETLEAVLTERVEVIDRLVAATARAVEAGVATAADLADAQAMEAELDQRRLTLEGRLFACATRLSVAMGQRPDRILRTEGSLPEPELPALPSMERLASAERMPSVVALRLTELAAQAREVEASAPYAPSLQVGAQLERSASNAWTVYGIVGLSFNGFGQADRATSIARAEAATAATEAEAAILRARAELRAALHEVVHTRRTLDGLEARLLPALAALRERRSRALTLGEGTLFAVLDARRRELALRERLVRARGERAWAEVRMWVLFAELERAEDDR